MMSQVGVLTARLLSTLVTNFSPVLVSFPVPLRFGLGGQGADALAPVQKKGRGLLLSLGSLCNVDLPFQGFAPTATQSDMQNVHF